MGAEENRIPGIILDEDETNQTIEDLVEEVIIIVRLAGQSQLYTFDMSNNHSLIAKIFEDIEEEDLN